MRRAVLALLLSILGCGGSRAEPSAARSGEHEGADPAACADLVASWRRARTTPVGFAACLTSPRDCGLRKNSQYDEEITEPHGKMACGLIASSSAVLRPSRVAEVAAIRALAGDAYTSSTGIQPRPLAAALRARYPAPAVAERDRASLVDLHDALAAGDAVIVDFLAIERDGRSRLTAAGSTFAHFGRVLALDPVSGRVFIENSLTPADESVYAVDAATFCEAWRLPEVRAVEHPPPPLDPVSRWFVTIGREAVDARGRTCNGLPSGSYCGAEIAAERSTLYACDGDRAVATERCARGCVGGPPGRCAP